MPHLELRHSRTTAWSPTVFVTTTSEPRIGREALGAGSRSLSDGIALRRTPFRSSKPQRTQLPRLASTTIEARNRTLRKNHCNLASSREQLSG